MFLCHRCCHQHNYCSRLRRHHCHQHSLSSPSSSSPLSSSLALLPTTICQALCWVLFLHNFNRRPLSYEVGPLHALVPLLVMLLPAPFWLTLADPSFREHFRQPLPREDIPPPPRRPSSVTFCAHHLVQVTW